MMINSIMASGNTSLMPGTRLSQHIFFYVQKSIDIDCCWIFLFMSAVKKSRLLFPPFFSFPTNWAKQKDVLFVLSLFLLFICQVMKQMPPWWQQYHCQEISAILEITSNQVNFVFRNHTDRMILKCQEVFVLYG